MPRDSPSAVHFMDARLTIGEGGNASHDVTINYNSDISDWKDVVESPPIGNSVLLGGVECYLFFLHDLKSESNKLRKELNGVLVGSLCNEYQEAEPLGNGAYVRLCWHSRHYRLRSGFLNRAG